MKEDEEWRPVVGYEEYYEVSSLGRIKSLERDVVFKDGRVRHYPERIKVVTHGKFVKRSNVTVHLCVNQIMRRCSVAQLVWEAFVGENPDYVRHRDNDITNNKLSNLYADTSTALKGIGLGHPYYKKGVIYNPLTTRL